VPGHVTDEYSSISGLADLLGRAPVRVPPPRSQEQPSALLTLGMYMQPASPYKLAPTSEYSLGAAMSNLVRSTRWAYLGL
jgi:hypothetical protein